MTRLTLELPDDLRRQLEARAAQSGHASIEDQVTALIREALETDHAPGPEHLRVQSADDLTAKLREGLDSPASEVTDADWDDMRRRFLKRHDATRPR
jgi:plasmid stability protein